MYFKGGGTGIRTLIDNYVIRRRDDSVYDWNYIHGELEKLELSSFEEKIRSLSDRLFSDPHLGMIEELTNNEVKLLSYMMNSGMYGSLENAIENGVGKYKKDQEAPASAAAVGKYIWFRLFPGIQQMKMYSPLVEKHPWTMPFMYPYRMVRAMVVRGKEMKREVLILLNMLKSGIK